MSKLAAHFKIPLDQPLFVSLDQRREFSFQIRMDNFNASIRLRPETYPTHDSESGSRSCVFLIDIDISREESLPIDLKQRSDFFHEHSRSFSTAAYQVTNRIISFFKFRLHQPLLEEIPAYKNCFLIPTWYEDGKKIFPESFSFTEEYPAGLESEHYGVKCLCAEMTGELEAALERENSIELYEEILANAQSAIFQGNLSRAVLEMAMACELAIRSVYFSRSSTAGLALEFLEDSQKMSSRVKITDYLSKIAEYALGEKFEDVSGRTAMENIENLFHGRNKVVHRGKLLFKRDNEREPREIDSGVLKEWWNSVEKLLAWLGSKRAI